MDTLTTTVMPNVSWNDFRCSLPHFTRNGSWNQIAFPASRFRFVKRFLVAISCDDFSGKSKHEMGCFGIINGNYRRFTQLLDATGDHAGYSQELKERSSSELAIAVSRFSV